MDSRRKSLKKNFDKKRMSCYDDKEKFCEAYAELFFKNQETEEKVLKHSLHLKTVESYMTLMKEIVPKSKMDEAETKKTLVFCVVIDDYVESMEDTLNMLAKRKSDTNAMEDVRKSLSRFRKKVTKIIIMMILRCYHLMSSRLLWIKIFIVNSK